MNGIGLINKEKERQDQLWTADHDDQHDEGELALVAALYATPVLLKILGENGGDIVMRDPWPISWDYYRDKRPIITSSGRLLAEPGNIMKKERIKNLSIAGALIASEIDRLSRIQEKDFEEAIGPGSYVQKNSRKPFQNGDKTGIVHSLDNMMIKGRLFPCVYLIGCESPVELRRIKNAE